MKDLFQIVWISDIFEKTDHNLKVVAIHYFNGEFQTTTDYVKVFHKNYYYDEATGFNTNVLSEWNEFKLVEIIYDEGDPGYRIEKSITKTDLLLDITHHGRGDRRFDIQGIEYYTDLLLEIEKEEEQTYEIELGEGYVGTSSVYKFATRKPKDKQKIIALINGDFHYGTYHKEINHFSGVGPDHYLASCSAVHIETWMPTDDIIQSLKQAK